MINELLIIFPGWLIALLFAAVIIMVFIIIAAVAFWVWGIIDCLSSGLSSRDKLLWVIIMALLGMIGTGLYIIFARKEGREESGKMRERKEFSGKKLFRSRSRMIAGVCGGFAEYFGIDPTIVRLLWVVLTLLSFGTGIIAYIIAWIIMPEKR